MINNHSICFCGLSHALSRFISGIDGIERLIGNDSTFHDVEVDDIHLCWEKETVTIHMWTFQDLLQPAVFERTSARDSLSLNDLTCAFCFFFPLLDPFRVLVKLVRKNGYSVGIPPDCLPSFFCEKRRGIYFIELFSQVGLTIEMSYCDGGFN